MCDLMVIEEMICIIYYRIWFIYIMVRGYDFIRVKLVL